MGFVLFYRGIHEVGPAEAASWMYFVPPLTALFQWIFTGTALAPIQFVGLFVVLIGIATVQHFRTAASIPEAPAEPT
jgi:drug/metabolite transporter (DMT)-like permease